MFLAERNVFSSSPLYQKSTFVRCVCFVTSWQNRRGHCAARPAISVGNTLKAKLEELGTFMFKNLGSLVREVTEAGSQI